VLKVPSLRARREDVPFLVEYFLGEFNERYRPGVPGGYT
jgi:DNA-binding NtrC family response regulator